jgi:hypothetical protein
MDFTTTQTNQIARWILSGVQNKTRFLVDSVAEVDPIEFLALWVEKTNTQIYSFFINTAMSKKRKLTTLGSKQDKSWAGAG